MWTSYEGDFAPMAVEHELNFFQYNEEKDAYDAYNEIHRERAYDDTVIKDLLSQTGFLVTLASTDFGDKPFVRETKRWFFSTGKN